MDTHSKPDRTSLTRPYQPQTRTTSTVVRVCFFGLGMLFFVLGMVGVILPVLPTTPFMILAAACWAKSSRRFHRWLIHHPAFGKLIKDWQERRAIPRYAKYLAWIMMSISCAMLFYRLPIMLWWLAGMVSLVCLATGVWMARLPDA